MILIKVCIELAIEDQELASNSPQDIADFLNEKLMNDPEFFDSFGPENIVEVRGLE